MKLLRFRARHKQTERVCEFEYVSIDQAIHFNPDFEEWREIEKNEK